jgi:hypothetical protein
LTGYGIPALSRLLTGQNITALLEHTGAAIQCLRKPGAAEDPAGPDSELARSPDEQTAAFRAAMDTFLTTLHSVDVRLKRQIMGLEEAGIISLKSADRREQLAAVVGAGAEKD